MQHDRASADRTEITRLPAFPVRAAESHKGTYGRVAVIGGSIGLSGAPAMASLAALRAGSGLVTCLCPASINTILEIKLTEVMTHPLPVDADGALGEKALEELRRIGTSFNVVVAGPGLGRNRKTLDMLKSFFGSITCPAVVDADGLLLFPRDAPTASDMVLTPHPGEFARMLGESIDAVQRSRLEKALQYTASHDAILVLKGNKTIVAQGDKYYINSTGNPGLATGGAGDVLSGIIGSLLGRGFEPFDAACLGCWLHGRAGDLAAGALGEESVIAGDLITFLPRAIQERKSP